MWPEEYSDDERTSSHIVSATVEYEATTRVNPAISCLSMLFPLRSFLIIFNNILDFYDSKSRSKKRAIRLFFYYQQRW
jgi:hypothetical protein